MTKTELINDVAYEMSTMLNSEQIDRMKIVLYVKLQNHEISESECLPMVTEQKDLEWLLKRYTIDSLASGVKESSIKQIVGTVVRFMNDIKKDYRQITGQDLTDWLAIKQYRDHISTSYKATLYRQSSVFWKWAYRKHHIETDIMRDVDCVKTIPKPKARISDEEVARCRQAVEGDVIKSAFLELMLSTGMRVGEIRNLKVSDINFQKDEVHIWGEKSSKWRTGYISPDCKVAILRYLNGRRDGYLFPGRLKTGICKQTAEQMAREIGEAAQCSVITTVHVYRKTFASITYRKTRDIVLVSRLLGHADTETTLKHYLVDDIEDMMNTMRRVA